MWWFIALACLIQTFTSSEELIKKKRGMNPETFMNVSQLICYKGYPSEEYEVLTEDGYYLRINRIPYGREKPTDRGPKPAVLLQHGLFAEGSNWVENLANNSLGFMLADAGYDVWIGNSRGTTWSRRHQKFSVDQEEFWDFSFHEMGIYDLQAMINFILQETGQKQLYYVGYSQGGTIALIAFSSMPQLAQKVKMFFALSPAATIAHVKSPIVKLLRIPEETLKAILGKKDFCLWGKTMKEITAKICCYELPNRLCANLFFFAGGFNQKNLNMSRLDVYTDHFPDGTSAKNVIHWAQALKSGEFKYFDYGSENQAKYNQSVPPFYKIEDMTVPTAVWSGGEDWVVDSKDIDMLLPRITNLIYHKHVSDWNHWDFIWGLDAAKRVYSEIIEMMEKYL
ncbi:putative lysosomal acid lipase/cholesteryl ester hydrolase isoform X1 [Pelodiscus sinensis]|uniref:putative lysosomal acid lipase/cholesteryl ester hydrolase isoform X1 n=1 Tax=Pelodiscus sinensis TaxID=13735 RepID=UPI003F6BE2B4